MALFNLTDTFAYISLSDSIVRVDGTDVVDRGAWNSSATYGFRDVILYSGGLFVCLVANTNQPPTSIRDDFWSSLVKTTIGQGEITLDDVYALATEALSTAGEAFTIATAGTLLAYQALQTAWQGTSASVQTSYPALVAAWVGTATANVALSVASTGTDLALSALQTAWAGTATADVALSVAYQGTSLVAAEALVRAAADIVLQNEINVLTASGTSNAGLSYQALQTAWSGTAGVAQVEAIAVSGSNTANSALSLASTLSGVLGAGATGTQTFYAAQTPNARIADLRVTTVGGVVTAIAGSRYNWEDFEPYALGVVGQGTGDLGLNTSWAGTGSIYTATMRGFYGSDTFSSYSSGTNSTGAWAGGMGWAGPGATLVPFQREIAIDPMSYGAAIGISGSYISSGTGWAGTNAVIYAR